MTVRGRLIASFAVITAVLMVPALYAAARLSELRNIAVEERGRHASAVLALGHLETALAELNNFERSFVATADPQLRAQVQAGLQRVNRLVRELESSRFGAESAFVHPVLRQIDRRTREIDTLVVQGELEEATEAFREMEGLFPAAEERLARVAESIDRQAQEDFERARAISASARRTTLFGLVSFLLVAAFVALWTTGALTQPLRKLAGATAEVAQGSFHAPEDLPYDRSDEIGELSRSFHTMTERLAELDRMKAEFVGVASHELKTPINVIQGYAALIEEELAGELTEQQQEVLHGIAEQTRVLTRLVSRLMDISRLETGTYRTEMEEVHLQDLVTGLVRSFDILAEQKEITLESVVEESAPETMFMDMDIIRDEVLGNLVSNALEHTPPGGTVRIQVRGRNDGALFQVSDSGPGIPEEHRAQIFEKYYQVERSRLVGAGLGLAIAREMVELHGGSIELAEGGGPGATFRVFLPRVPPGLSDPPIPQPTRQA